MNERMEQTDSVAESDHSADLLPYGELGLAEALIKCGHLHGRAREPSSSSTLSSLSTSPINTFSTPLRRAPNRPYRKPPSVQAQPPALPRRKLAKLRARSGYGRKRRRRT